MNLIIPMIGYFCLHAHAAGGNIYSTEIGGIVMQNNEHTFKYLAGEGGDTLWPSMSCIESING